MRAIISVTDLKILNASTVEIEQCKLPKEMHLAYRTVLRTLHFLNNHGYIRLVRTLPSQKGGKEKNIWLITERGKLLLSVLGEN